MNTLTRRIVYLLLITLVINVGGWTFNPEAVVDMGLDDQTSLAAGGALVSAPSDTGEADSVQLPCNHWCHAVANFMGLVSPWVPIFSALVNRPIPYAFRAIAPSAPDGRFRPPRLIS